MTFFSLLSHVFLSIVSQDRHKYDNLVDVSDGNNLSQLLFVAVNVIRPCNRESCGVRFMVGEIRGLSPIHANLERKVVC